jgi:hypothetical protein
VVGGGRVTGRAWGGTGLGGEEMVGGARE